MFGLILSLLTLADEVFFAHLHWLFTTCMLLECNDWQRLVLSINSHEIKESNRTCDRSLGYQTNFFAWGEKRAGHVLINMEINLCHIGHNVKLDLLVSKTENKWILNCGASVVTPKLFQVKTAEWYILSEYRINLLETTGHNINLVVDAAQRFRCIHKWTNLIHFWNRICT